MMGSSDKPQDELFYSFNLDEVVPEDHLLRNCASTWLSLPITHPR
jgi:hypothetical protein